MLVSKTTQRKQDLVAAISDAVQRGSLTKQETLVLRGTGLCRQLHTWAAGKTDLEEFDRACILETG